MQTNNRTILISEAQDFADHYVPLLTGHSFEVHVAKGYGGWVRAPRDYQGEFFLIDNRDGTFIYEVFLPRLKKLSPQSVVINVSDSATLNPQDGLYIFNIPFGGDMLSFDFFLKNLGEFSRQSRQRTEFAAMLIHDVRSPLNSLISYIELLLNQTFGPMNEGQRNFLEKAMNLGDQTLDMLEEINDIYRSEKYTFTLDKENFDLQKVLDESLLNVWIQADQKNIKIRKDLPANPLTLHADPFQVQRVFVNLLGNAIQYSPHNSTVIVRVRSNKNNFVEFSVIDNGGTIPEAKARAIFSKAYRLEKTRNLHKGQGLGLYICKLIVRAHGGGIRVENNDIGGTSFIATLPMPKIAAD